jgi:AraC-like DNA-binding protein
MPIALLQHIVSRQSGSAITEIVPAITISQWVQAIYVLTLTDNETTTLAFNDGIPTMAFLPIKTDHVDIFGENEVLSLHSAWLSTQVLENTRIRHASAHQQLLIIRFHPFAFYSAFGLTAANIMTQPAWDLDELGMPLSALHNLVQAQSSVADKILSIEAFFHQKNEVAQTSNYLFEKALSLIRQQRGQTSIREMLADLRVNHKWLDRSFQHHLGISPKQYARLQRFINAYAALLNNNGKDLLSIAINNGYYDQHHFTKEFRRFTGQAPLTYMKRQRA